MSPTISESDLAFVRFKKQVEDRTILGVDDPKLSESDTRAKLIDPVFREVLGWSESETRREKPLVQGYVDYVLGLETGYLVLHSTITVTYFESAVTQQR